MSEALDTLRDVATEALVILGASLLGILPALIPVVVLVYTLHPAS